jgi:hypothetical protein
MLSFSTSANTKIEVVITCDNAVNLNDEEKLAYLKGDRSVLKIHPDKQPTYFIIKALSPVEREEAEIKAGAYTRSELGRLLFIEQPSDLIERANWQHNLSENKKKAFAEYNAYLNRVYQEMIKASVVEIKGVEGNVWDLIQSIKPDAIRLQTISELVTHISTLSLLGDSGK